MKVLQVQVMQVLPLESIVMCRKFLMGDQNLKTKDSVVNE